MTGPARFSYKGPQTPWWLKTLCGLIVLSVFYLAFYCVIQENPAIATWLSGTLHSRRFIILLLLTGIVIGCCAAILYIIINSRRIVMTASGYLLYPLMGLQHRFIAQKCLGRKLHWGEEVHHINGKRNDNRIINLCVMTSEDHKNFHSWLSYERQRRRRYPPIREQKYILATEFNGILLEDIRSV